MAEAIEGLLTALPEMQSLREQYASAKIAGSSVDERLAWIRERLSGETLADLRNEELAALAGVDPDVLAYGVVDDWLRTWNDKGRPGLITALLAPQVERMTFPDGSPLLVACIHQFTELEPLFEAIRAAHAQTFPPFRVRPATVEDLTFVCSGLGKGMTQSEIAWEFVYRDHPHAALMDKKKRKQEYGDLHKKAYARVRWLKTKARDAVNQLAPEPSQESE